MYTENDLLRHVEFDGYTLKLFDTNRVDRMGKATLGYEMYRPDGLLLFTGEDFHCSPMHAIDSDETVRALLGFLLLRPGDTDEEYFKDYTLEQMQFAEDEAEQLQMWGMEPQNDDEYPAPEFINLDGWTKEG